MPTKASSAGAQQTLSSFFKPATASQKRPPPDEVLILDSDDDDDQDAAPASAGARTLAGTSKKIKLEHDTRATQFSPIASTSELAPIAAATSPSSAKTPSASAKRIREFAYLEGKERAPRTTPSDADRARHDAFVKRLSLGPNLLQKRNSYLQKEHHLAAAEQDTDGVLRHHGAAAGMSSTNTEDLEEEEDEQEDSPSIDTSRSKGKGKAKEVAPSRLAKFAAKGKSSAASPGGDSVKYTPLEQQVLALRKANPGVLLIVEVRPTARLKNHIFTTVDKINRDGLAGRVQVPLLRRRCPSRLPHPQHRLLSAAAHAHRVDPNPSPRRTRQTAPERGVQSRNRQTARNRRVSALHHDFWPVADAS
jgi:DNA mismatch repair protein MSH3